MSKVKRNRREAKLDDCPVADKCAKEGEPSGRDYFQEFFAQPVSEQDCAQLRKPKTLRSHEKVTLTGLGPSRVYGGLADAKTLLNEVQTSSNLSWNERLVKNLDSSGVLEDEANKTRLNVISRYVDILNVTDQTSKDYRSVYLAHMLNHVIRTKNLIVGNNQRLKALAESGKNDEDVVESCRDQGFAHPVALILCPFKKDAYDIVQRLKHLIYGDEEKIDVWNKKRFESEFQSEEANEDNGYGIVRKPEDYKDMRTGNVDDCFRVGIALSKKTLKLFEPFKKSDILLCSPLGLRMILDGDVGSEKHLICSIQMTIIDTADILLQQNWEHVSLIFQHLNTAPPHISADISRVRQLYIDDQSKQFSQLMLFTRYQHEFFISLMMEHSLNHRGLVLHQPSCAGTLERIEIHLCQELHRFDVVLPKSQSEARFDYFKEKIAQCILPQTCIVVPSYFDFVRLRNHFKRNEESFVALHEYADKKKTNRARDMFFHERKSILLVTERFHYYRRFNLRGMKQLIFYQLPSHPDFYADFINMAMTEGTRRMKAILLYCKIDQLRLENTFGTEMAKGIMASPNQIQAIVSEV